MTTPSVELEYTAIRGEQLQRLSGRQTLIGLTLTLIGGFLGVGWTQSAIVLMTYPLVALLLGAYWAQNEIHILRLSEYLRDYLEPNLPGAGYERWSRGQENALTWMGLPLEIAAVAGILLLGQIFAFVMGVLYALFVDRSLGLLPSLFALADIIAIGAMVVLIGTVGGRARR